MNVFLRNFFGTLLSAALLVGCAANQMHRNGLADIERGNYEAGVSELTQAVERDPHNMMYKLDLAARREASIQKLISAGDALRGGGQLDAAVSTYRRVLVINPADQRALRGIEGVDLDRRHAAMVAEAGKDFERKDYDAADTVLRSVLNEDAGFGPATALAAKINLARGPTTVAPRLKTRNNAKVTLQFRDAPTKMVFEVLARQTGINFILDKDVKSDAKTTIFVQEVPIDEAIDLVLDQNTLARQILSSNMVLIYPNTPAKQKDYEEQIVHTFYLTNAAPKDVESMLKSMLGAKTLFVDERTSVVVMRDTPDAVRMAEKLVASIDVPEPEVLIEVEVLEIARSKLLNLGITYPGSITASATSVAGAAATGGTSGLVLSDLSHQSSNSIAVSSVSATLNALQTVGNTNTLASPRIRARNKEKAKILIGSRVPVITSSTALLTSGTASSSSVQYLDVGLTLEVQPTVYLDGDVAIKVGLEVSSITNTVQVAGTQAYTIGTRNANTLLRLKDGETQILAGLIQDSDTRNAAGIPGLSQIPIVGRLFGSNNTDREKSEIVLSITPRIIRAQARPSNDATEFWYGTETRSRSAPFAGGFDNSASAASGPGGASGGSSAGGPGIPTVGPRVSVSQPVIPAAPAAVPPPAAPAGPPPHPTVTVDGPGEIAVGQEFDVTVRLATDIGISRLRGQVRFDSSALQLVSATAGELVPASAGSPTVDGKAGGAQMDVVAPDDPVQGEGSLMLLRFKALAARPASSIAAQVSAMGPAGGAMANAASQPLSVAIKP
ncbi:MAG TPA: secretin N-terminal domain-containing protein [Steroidobacteraceae bacterium]|nr:secretin N-terminal domain-containing protein [Steroidobacteraceae bacterium]